MDANRPGSGGRRHVEEAWLAHVRGGGTTPWGQWLRTNPPDANPPDAARHQAEVGTAELPGAAQIETVRRLAEVAAAEGLLAGRAFERLADLVLQRSAPGRGMAERRLSWGDPRGPSFGPPPIDPSLIPNDELIRVCVGALVEQVTSGTSRLSPSRPARRRPWARQFLLLGAPVSASALRAALGADRRFEGGRRPEVLIVAAGFDEMLQQVWTLRVLLGADTGWARFVRRWAHRDRLPIAADLPRLAGHWVERVGREHVHVVVPPPGDAADGHRHLRRTAAELLGLSQPAEPPERVEVPALSPAAVDVLRRVNAVLGGRVDPEVRRDLIRESVGTLFRPGMSAGLQVPADMGDWARGRSERITDELRAGGYPVHGDLDQIVSRRTPEAHDAPRPARVLDTALRACLLAARR